MIHCPPLPEGTDPSIKAQRNPGKSSSDHGFPEAISLRKMRFPVLPLVFNS